MKFCVERWMTARAGVAQQQQQHKKNNFQFKCSGVAVFSNSTCASAYNHVRFDFVLLGINAFYFFVV